MAMRPNNGEGARASVHYAEGLYGFEWGAAKVERCFSDERKGWVTLTVKTTKHDIQIYITKTGKVRVHDKANEWKPNRK